MNFSRLRCLLLVLCVPWLAHGQTVNSGSNGSDGAFNPTTSRVINMADHPDGVYHYTSVNIPTGVTVSFLPNAKNTPVVWLVQGGCEISGIILANGEEPNGGTAGRGGPGGYRGGNGGVAPMAGQGPGGGPAAPSASVYGGAGSFATQGSSSSPTGVGATYGNIFLLPLTGGSGGGGGSVTGGSGGGGAMLIASSAQINLGGTISAGFDSGGSHGNGGGGSGGALRFIAQRIAGNGLIVAGGHNFNSTVGGNGRIRFDAYENQFGGTILGAVLTQGFQPIILPVAGQSIQLAIASVAGGSVPPNPSSSLANPAVIVPAQPAASVPVVVQCFNVPLNTPITVTARPANGAAVSASGFNSSGTAAASTATIALNLPRGSGILMAKATVATTGAGPASLPGKAGGASLPASSRGRESALVSPQLPDGKNAPTDVGGYAAAKLADLPYSVTGLTTDGERIAALEMEATLGGPSRTVYVTESGKRIPAPAGR